jgi:predicted nucleic acid-binding protein
MIVLDANILIRAMRARRVRQLLETYAAQGLRLLHPMSLSLRNIFLRWLRNATNLTPMLRRFGILQADCWAN